MPTAGPASDDRLRVYFGPRDADGRTRTACVDLDPGDPSTIVRLHPDPVLDLGTLGAFDDSGAMPSCSVDVDGDVWLFYIGWNRGVTVPYRNAVGVAVSSDGGLSFTRAFPGAIVDRDRDEPFFTSTPWVLREPAGWRMWYASTVRWDVVDGRPEPVYVIKYAESDDGLTWKRENRTCIEPLHPDEANARPTVVRDEDGYRMWFSHRGSRGYRDDPSAGYRIGYAESADGIVWERDDARAGIDVSADGWDARMQAYPCVYEQGGALHMLYAGNGFGRAGFGHAVAS
jgi:hypothetical protein